MKCLLKIFDKCKKRKHPSSFIDASGSSEPTISKSTIGITRTTSTSVPGTQAPRHDLDSPANLRGAHQAHEITAVLMPYELDSPANLQNVHQVHKLQLQVSESVSDSISASGNPDTLVVPLEQDSLNQHSSFGFFANAQNTLIAGGTFINQINVHSREGLEMKIPVPQQPNSSPLFTGRKDVLEKLGKIFAHRAQNTRPRRSCLLWGIAGIGKTEICLKFTEEMSESFPHVFWIDATSHESIVMSFKGISNISAAQISGVDNSIESVLKWIASIQEEWLIVFDNADGLSLEVVAKFFPPGDSGNILITSRNRSMGRFISFENMIEISEMEEPDTLPRASYADPQPSAEHLPSAKDTAGRVQAGSFVSHQPSRALLPEPAQVFCAIPDQFAEGKDYGALPQLPRMGNIPQTNGQGQGHSWQSVPAPSPPIYGQDADWLDQLDWEDVSDTMDPFAEGKDYGPVLDPFLVRVLGAAVKLNPLISPLPGDGSNRVHLIWNMLFPTSTLQRSSDSSYISWSKGRNSPATFPRISSLYIVSYILPWVLVVVAGNVEIGVTCGEVIDSIGHQLLKFSNKDDYEQLTPSLRNDVGLAYRHNRSRAPGAPGGNTMGQGMRRLDFLRQKTMFAGIEVNDCVVKRVCGDVLPCVFVLKCRKQGFPVMWLDDEEEEEVEDKDIGRHMGSSSRPVSTASSLPCIDIYPPSETDSDDNDSTASSLPCIDIYPPSEADSDDNDSHL